MIDLNRHCYQEKIFHVLEIENWTEETEKDTIKKNAQYIHFNDKRLLKQIKVRMSVFVHKNSCL